jgi:hypothetical protein
MCTVSWLRDADGYDLFFNRDEKRSRLAAAPPTPRKVGSTTVLAPIDGEAGGTWLAANEHGLTLALLNGYLGNDSAAPPAGGWTSRGHLVLRLADCSTVTALVDRLEATDLASFRSFHLAAFDLQTGTLASWRDAALELSDGDSFSAPLISSSYRYEDVSQSRRERFREFETAGSGPRVETMLAYHRSHHPERGAYSACMHREDARTVSFTWIRAEAGEVRMRYSPDSPCRGWPPGPPLVLSTSSGNARARAALRDRSSTNR